MKDLTHSTKRYKVKYFQGRVYSDTAKEIMLQVLDREKRIIAAARWAVPINYEVHGATARKRLFRSIKNQLSCPQDSPYFTVLPKEVDIDKFFDTW